MIRKIKELLGIVKPKETMEKKDVSRINLILQDYGEAISNFNERLNKLEQRLSKRVGRPKSKKVNEDNANKARKPNN